MERSLRELAETRRRIDSGIVREQVPAEPQPVRASKFVNPPPAIAPTWFQDRQVETGLLAKYVTDAGIRLVTVAGRGGVGKTAMVCRFLRGLEAGCIPDVKGDLATITAGGIVYLSSNGAHRVNYPTLIADLLRLLAPDAAQRLEQLYQDPHHVPAKLMLSVLEAFPAGEPVVVLLDNLETVMDDGQETLREQALHEALTALLTAPAHVVTVIATTRVTPTELLKIETARQRRLRLEEGLGSPDAETVLRALDDDGHLGLRDAADELLDGLREHTRGFPRALEAVKAILEGDETLTPADLLDRTRNLPEDQVVQVLVGDAYDLLDGPARQVMQALSVYPAPVSAVGVDFLLQLANPTIDAAPILTRLVRRQLVRFQNGHYHLHPTDRDYARSKLASGNPGDSPAAFTLTGLQARAADYYAQIRTPRESWRTLDDIQPQLAEFELRCDTGDYDAAATVLQDIDFEYLALWGHYRTLVDLHGRIYDLIADPLLNIIHLIRLGNYHRMLGDYRQAIGLLTQARGIARDTGYRQHEGATLGNLGSCHFMLGDFRQAIDLLTQAVGIARDTGALGSEGTGLTCLGNSHFMLGDYAQGIDLHTQALGITRAIGDRRVEGAALNNLGHCHFMLGDYQQGIDLTTQAVVIAREIGDRYGEANALDYLGRSWLGSGDPHRALALLKQAVDVADAIGDIESAVEARSWLAQAYLQLGDPAAALATVGGRPESLYPTGEPLIRLMEGLALLELHRTDEGIRAFRDVLTATDALLALADSNVAALQARALALTGLAIAASDSALANQATQAFALAHTVASAEGVAADTRRLLNMIISHDRSGILVTIRTAQEP